MSANPDTLTASCGGSSWTPTAARARSAAAPGYVRRYHSLEAVAVLDGTAGLGRA